MVVGSIPGGCRRGFRGYHDGYHVHGGSYGGHGGRGGHGSCARTEAFPGPGAHKALIIYL